MSSTAYLVEALLFIKDCFFCIEGTRSSGPISKSALFGETSKDPYSEKEEEREEIEGNDMLANFALDGLVLRRLVEAENKSCWEGDGSTSDWRCGSTNTRVEDVLHPLIRSRGDDVADIRASCQVFHPADIFIVNRQRT